MIDVVYQYFQGPAKWDELRYSLRSLDKHLKIPFRLWFAGDMPDWVQNATHIPVEHIYDDFLPVCLDAVRKLNAAITHRDMGQKMLYMYDDIYLTSEVKMADLKRVFALPRSKNAIDIDKVDRSTFPKHTKLKFRTIDALRAKKRCLPGADDAWVDFENHLPKFFDRKKMVEVFQTYAPGKNRLLMFSLYYNHHRPANIEFLERGNDVKLALYGPRELPFDGKPSDNVNQLKSWFENHKFMNHNDAGLTPELRQALQEYFTDKSRFEK